MQGLREISSSCHAVCTGPWWCCGSRAERCHRAIEIGLLRSGAGAEIALRRCAPHTCALHDDDSGALWTRCLRCGKVTLRHSTRWHTRQDASTIVYSTDGAEIEIASMPISLAQSHTQSLSPRYSTVHSSSKQIAVRSAPLAPYPPIEDCMLHLPFAAGPCFLPLCSSPASLARAQRECASAPPKPRFLALVISSSSVHSPTLHPSSSRRRFFSTTPHRSSPIICNPLVRRRPVASHGLARLFHYHATPIISFLSPTWPPRPRLPISP